VIGLKCSSREIAWRARDFTTRSLANFYPLHSGRARVRRGGGLERGVLGVMPVPWRLRSAGAVAEWCRGDRGPRAGAVPAARCCGQSRGPRPRGRRRRGGSAWLTGSLAIASLDLTMITGVLLAHRRRAGPAGTPTPARSATRSPARSPAGTPGAWTPAAICLYLRTFARTADQASQCLPRGSLAALTGGLAWASMVDALPMARGRHRGDLCFFDQLD
jgi:hypothetical protein